MKNRMDYGDLPMTIGGNIRRLRRSLDYTQEYVAEKLEVSLSTYARMEKGLAPVNMIRLRRLSEILMVSSEDLFLE